MESAGDAINFRLDQCEQGLDVNTEAGRVSLLKKATDVLASIQNPLEREVYISRTANKWDIEKTVLRNQIQRKIQKTVKLKQSKEWKTIIQNTAQPVKNAVDSPIHLRETKAEERILCYLFNHPNECPAIQLQLSSSHFLTPLYQRVYKMLCEKMQLASFSSVFSDAEMGRIIGITAKNAETPITKEDVLECINVLRTYHEHTIEDDDDLLMLVEKAKKNR